MQVLLEHFCSSFDGERGWCLTSADGSNLCVQAVLNVPI